MKPTCRIGSRQKPRWERPVRAGEIGLSLRPMNPAHRNHVTIGRGGGGDRSVERRFPTRFGRCILHHEAIEIPRPLKARLAPVASIVVGIDIASCRTLEAISARRSKWLRAGRFLSLLAEIPNEAERKNEKAVRGSSGIAGPVDALERAAIRYTSPANESQRAFRCPT